MCSRSENKRVHVTVKTPYTCNNGEILYREEEFFMKSGKTLYEMIACELKVFLRGCNRGECGKCAVRFLSGGTIPAAADRMRFTAEELRDGYRLACKSFPKTDCQVELHYLNERQIPIVTDSTKEEKAVTKPVFIEEESKNNGYYIAIDVGTTTVVMQLRDRKTGLRIAEYAGLNAQCIYGPDVISRMKTALDGKEKELQELLLEQIVQGSKMLLKEAGVDDITKENLEDIPIYIAANTVMMHLLFGRNVKGLSVAPFRPDSLDEMRMVKNDQTFYGMPGFGAFVGADLAADVLANKERIMHRNTLLVDLGTNAEMMLFAKGKVVATATAAGSAFDGGTNQKLLGTDLIGACAVMLRKGILDESGLMRDEFFENGYVYAGDLVRQKDVREIQKAKAAVRTGISFLLKELSLEENQVESVLLCGGFGKYLSVEDAVIIGMFPQSFLGKTVSCGNQVLSGIACYVSDRNGSIRYLNELRERMNVLNLAEREEFGKRYIEECNFR